MDLKRKGGGAKQIYNYAKRKGLQIINLYTQDDVDSFQELTAKVHAFNMILYSLSN